METVQRIILVSSAEKLSKQRAEACSSWIASCSLWPRRDLAFAHLETEASSYSLVDRPRFICDQIGIPCQMNRSHHQYVACSVHCDPFPVLFLDCMLGRFYGVDRECIHHLTSRCVDDSVVNYLVLTLTVSAQDILNVPAKSSYDEDANGSAAFMTYAQNHRNCTEAAQFCISEVESVVYVIMLTLNEPRNL